MTFAQAKKCLEQGMTLEEVLELKDISDNNTDTTSADDKPADSDINLGSDASTQKDSGNAVPAWATSLNNSINNLSTIIQAQAIVNSTGAKPKSAEEAADDVLKSLFDVQIKKE